MQNSVSADALVRAVSEAVEAYRELPAQADEAATALPGPTRRGQPGAAHTNNRERVLAGLIETALPGWLDVAAQIARQNGYIEVSRPRLVGPNPAFELLSLICRHEDMPGTVAATRFVGFLCGPPLAPVEYVTVDIGPQWPVVDLFDGWQLAACDDATRDFLDEVMPIFSWSREIAMGSPARNPGRLHARRRHGAVRHLVSADRPTASNPGDERVLIWPLLALNLFTERPVRAGVTYWIEPGRDITGQDLPSGSEHTLWPATPPELARWTHDPDDVPELEAAVLSRNECDQLSRFAGVFGNLLAALDGKSRQTYARAVDHYLFVRFRTYFGRRPHRREPPELHPSEAAFRWTVALESLLVSQSGPDLSRKVSQRAAMLIGRSDAERLAIERIVRAAYSIRSTYAHGGADRSPSAADLADIFAVTRSVITLWPVLASRHGRNLDRVLDNALLSHQVLADQVRQPIEQFLKETGFEVEIHREERTGT